MTQDTQAGARAQPAPAIQPVYLPLQQECADYATSLRSTTMQVKLEGRPEPQSMVRAADLFERAATRITQLDASASQLIEERDHAQNMADRLAQAISEEFRVDVGEHSNLNCPWHQALAVLNGEYTTDSDKDRCIAVQAGELAAARAEAKHRRTNHDNVVARLRIFTQRPDIPKELTDRLPWYRELVRLQAVEAQALQQSAEITDAEIDRIAESMPGGLAGFLKAWGWRQFARAILQAAPPAPAAVAVPAASEVLDALNYVDDFIARCNGDDRGSCASVNLLRAALAAAPAQAAAWMTPEGDRVVTESTMAGARKDGGAMLSSLRPFTVALGRIAAPAQEHATQLAGQRPRTPGSFVNAAGIHAFDKPATVVRKLDAAFHDAVTFADTPAQTQGCTRSHPHEEMTPMCVLRTEIARLHHAAANAQAQEGARDHTAVLCDLLNRRPAMNSGLDAEYAAWSDECYRVMGALSQAAANDDGVQEDAHDLEAEALRACRDLPEGWEIVIYLEKGYGGVVLIDPEDNENDLPVDGMLFDALKESIDQAVQADAARAAQGGAA